MRKKYQRLLAVLLTWVMCLTLMQGTVRAEVFVEEDAQSPTDIIVEAEESAGENNEIEEEEIPDDLSQTSVEIYINPLYRDVISEEDLVESDDSALLQSEESGNGEERVSLSSEEYGSVDEAVVSFREQMKSRKEIITVKVMTDDVEEIAGEISDAAMAHTGNPKEGDYLQWQFGGWKCSSSYYSFGGNYYCTMNYTMTYYTTAAQEAELDNAIALAKTNLGLNSSTMNDYQKIKAIYDYMTKNITYDYANLNDDSYRLKYTAYAAMINKTAVCQGYAVLLYRMALECGVDARVITGIGNGGAHGWNIVKLGNYYYNVDSTWDAGYSNYSYFLKTDGNFRYHTRDNEYATGDFYEAYPMAASDYNVNHVHQYGSWMTAKAATCLEEGMQMKTCSLCGDKKTQSTAKTGHTEVKDAAVEATCTSTGKTEGSHCSVCGTVIKAQTEIAKKAHTYGSWKVVKSVTCTVDGSKERSCTECGKKETQAIAKTGHTEVKDAAVEATCTSTGKTEGSHCSVCGTVIKAQTEIAKKAHTWGAWKTISSATVFAPKKQKRTCTRCNNAYEKRFSGEKLKKTISVTQSSLTMQVKQKTTAFRVTFANGDSVKSWTSSNTRIVKVFGKSNGTCTITAQNRTGSATITITLKSGLQKSVKVNVQKGAVAASSLKLPSTKVEVKKGKTLTLKPIIKPITSQSKVTYSTSNKSVATVSSSGVIKGVKKGTAKITVKAGTKKVVCTVIVK